MSSDQIKLRLRKFKNKTTSLISEGYSCLDALREALEVFGVYSPGDPAVAIAHRKYFRQMNKETRCR